MNNIRVLIVDDEEGFSSVMAKRLGRREMDVRTAISGEQALDILERESFQVVVLDMKMPGMNGLELLKLIRNTHPLLEVILLTGNADMECALESMTAGAFDFMLKPVNTEILAYRIMDAARNKQLLKQGQPSYAEPQAANS